MISKPLECFVYICLPEETEMVTAGKFVHSFTREGAALGKFIYAKSYLARPNAVEIDPIELPLRERSFETVRQLGVFGALRDASPDYWGRKLISLHVNKYPLTEMDYLLHSQEDRMGALGFGLKTTPPAPRREFNARFELEQLQADADSILNDEYASRLNNTASQIQAKELLLVQAGTSMGGARPKAVIEHENDLWLAKFNAPRDMWNNARVEHAMLQLASQCGIDTPLSQIERVGDRDILLIKRFDRKKRGDSYLRHRMVSALSLLQAEDESSRREKWSYLLLAETIRKISSRAKEDVQQLYKRMVFNALISNTDDHLRNHACLAKGKAWQLSPAYDLSPHPHHSIERRDLALICGKHDNRYANKYNLLSAAPVFLLTKEEACQIIEDMQKFISSSWYRVARASGVSMDDCQKIQSAFHYAGFNYEIQN